MDYRIEKDTMGEMRVPADKYWGAQTQRSYQNFEIGTDTMPAEIVHAFGILKKAAAQANCELGTISEEKMNYISMAADEVIEGKLMDNFGYGRVFIVLSGAMCAGLALLCLFWGQIWVIPFFALFMWDGTQSLCGGMCQQGIYSASTNLAAKEWIDEAVAAYSLTTNGGQFAGLLTASGLYWCITRCVPDGNVNEILQRYYLAVIPFFLIIFLLSALLAHDLKKIKK